MSLSKCILEPGSFPGLGGTDRKVQVTTVTLICENMTEDKKLKQAFIGRCILTRA